ncbi:MAG: hypothetical protein A2381_15495 [Bdellovibrionales bacterium RIFOXYB1_FULL_37_110]|nr:MAG: hypothetical protein A2417_07345 [Bdellovibrionales bacterium RIFOXYC1_FULL_37_79]OFZ57026.1 MAG: hypothetical protein A2381_15495 [Bdellovibrionales bacterium RIFOXYB1_FULL_37_110]OFZ64025.1 MAG: hypothetical protein A2577_16110 [Bdellovibrionales bacterium RIFOXYD1_FULL_36_51]
MSNITKILIKNPVIMFFLGFLLCLKCFALSTPIYPLLIPPDHKIQVQIAATEKDQKKGLSGVPSENFKADQGMLFCFAKEEIKVFWMPDTRFNLDIFFLGSDLTVLDIERNLPFYRGFANPQKIPRTRPIKAQHVLEMRADSPLAKKITKGMKLIWLHSKDLNQTISNAHLSQ